MTTTYQYAIPSSRLGARHESLESYSDSQQKQTNHHHQVPTEFSLVVILSPNAHLHDENDGDNHRSHTNENNANTTSNMSILLGKKLRGFGEGFYNCFGGKLEKSRGEHAHPAKGAVREVHEETGISIPLSVMEDGFVGTINFTFEDWDVNRAMKMHLYCVFVTLSRDAKYETSPQNGTTNMEKQPHQQQQYAHTPVTVHPKQIRGCDEIEPRWFHNVHDMPLDQMFADDSLWLTMLLTHYNAVGGDVPPPKKLLFDAWFHYHPGGTKTNSIMHHFIQMNTCSPFAPDLCTIISAPKPPKMTLEKRLFHALHVNPTQRVALSIKEFNENWAMANAVRSFMKEEERMEYVLDVAGGHGALAALFLLLVPKCHTAIVIDPAQCASGKKGVREAWSRLWSNDDDDDDTTTNNHTTTVTKKELRYRHECLRTGLREELDCILKKTTSTRVTVVACHACQHLTDETLQIASEYGVNVAVMPCCQKDHDGWWKGLTKRLVKSGGDNKNASLSIGALMDILAAGKMMGWETGRNAGVRYQVKMKLMKESISLQNRMILCRAVTRDTANDGNGHEDKKKELAHEKLTRAYHRAHKLPSERTPNESTKKTRAVTRDTDNVGNEHEDRKKELAHEKLTRAYHRAHKLPSDRTPNESTKKTLSADVNDPTSFWSIPSLLTGFCVGTAFSFLMASQLRKK